MFRLVLNALRARRAQTVALFTLTVLAALGASAAPWFMGWARDAVAEANIAVAPAEQRVVTARGAVRYAPEVGPPSQIMRERVSEHLDIEGSEVVVGARIYVNMRSAESPNAGSAGLYLNYRDDVCAQVRVEGRCPTGAGEVMVGRSTAYPFGLEIGDTVVFEGFRLPQPTVLTISGIYEVTDLLSTYWAATDLLSGPVGIIGTLIDEPAFVSEETLLAAQPDGLDMDFHVVLPPSVYHGIHSAEPGTDLVTVIATAANSLRQANLDVQSAAPRLVEQIRKDQFLVGLGIGVAATQLVGLCWFVLFLAVRHSSEERRPDIGLLKLRGAAPWRIWMLTAQQSTLPMIAGAAVGWVLGYLAAGVLARDLLGLARTADTDPAMTLRWSLAAAGAACLGALIAATVAEWGALRSSVVGLLRRVPARRRGWRAEVIDLVIVLLAVAGVYQGHADLSDSGGASALALLAPGLVGLAIALLLARTLPWVARSVGASALRSGRPGPALAALHVARRPGTQRVFAVMAVGLSVLTTASLYWHTATVAWNERAVLAVGADRVLAVRAQSSAALLGAVRAADPSGAYAMAVARTGGAKVEDRLLAVDSTRFAAVAELSEQYGLGDPGRITDLLRPAAHPSIAVSDGVITVDATGPVDLGPLRPVELRFHLAAADGAIRQANFGALQPDRRTYQATVSGCETACRLVSMELVAARRIAEGQPATVELYGITQAGAEVVSPAVLADVTRWRPQGGAIGIGNLISAKDGRLAISLHTGVVPVGQRVDARVFVADAATPLPVLLAGERPTARRAGDERVTAMGTEQVAFRVVGTANLLPRLGANGLLADLEYAQRQVARAGEAAALEVWLAPGAPEQIVTALRERGVQIVREETVASTADRLAEQGPGVALRFQIFAAAVILLLAAGTLVVTAAVERRPRTEELKSLRSQGLDPRSMRVAAYAGSAALVVAGLVAGVLAALVAQATVTASLPIFADGWALLPAPRGVQPVPLLLAVIAGTAALGAAAIAGAARVVAAVDRQAPGGQA